MASLDVDQKYLGRIAEAFEEYSPLVAKSIYQLLGLSVVLSGKLYRARKLRKLDTSRDTKSLQLYHHIIWLAREGLSILELSVLPHTQSGELGPEAQVLSTKLRASFHHIFCLFHNNPPITAASRTSQRATPLSPKQENGQRRRRSGSGSSPHDRRTSRESKGKKPLLRDPIDSITSDASFLTNPYAGMQPGTTPPPGLTPSMPPGFAPIAPKPAAFLLPAIDFVPNTATYFRAASNMAALLLPGAHPLRLSVAIEHSAFLWDCIHDHDGSRQLARRAIRALREGEEEGITDEQYDDAATMVAILGRQMRRRSWEGTPRPGQGASPATAASSSAEKMKSSSLKTSTTFPTTGATPSITPYRLQVYNDSEDSPEGQKGQPKDPPASPTQRRSSKSSQHTRDRNGTKSTTYTTTSRDRDAKDRTYYEDARLRSPETPPRPPPKDLPALPTGSSSARTSSKQSTPRRDTSTRVSPRDPRTPGRPQTASSRDSPRLSYPRPMDVSPKRPLTQQQQQQQQLPREKSPQKWRSDRHRDVPSSGYWTDEGYVGSGQS